MLKLLTGVGDWNVDFEVVLANRDLRILEGRIYQ